MLHPCSGNFTAVTSLPVFHSVTQAENGNGYYPGNDHLSSVKPRLFGHIRPGGEDQVKETSASLSRGAPAFVSVFAGRIADTGRDPVPLMKAAVEHLADFQNVELIWASPRELLNLFQADSIGCHVITATNDILRKLDLVGKDLTEYSLDTVKMFYNDGRKAGFTFDTDRTRVP